MCSIYDSSLISVMSCIIALYALYIRSTARPIDWAPWLRCASLWVLPVSQWNGKQMTSLRTKNEYLLPSWSTSSNNSTLKLQFQYIGLAPKVMMHWRLQVACLTCINNCFGEQSHVFFTVTLWIVCGETEPLSECVDHVSKVWRYPEKAWDFLETFSEIIWHEIIYLQTLLLR